MYSMTNSSGQIICVDVCPINYYTNTTTYSCLPCSSGCQVCSSPSSCVTCLTGFYSLNTQCLNQCPQSYIGVGSTCYQCASPCLTCVKSLSQCVTCIAGYKLLEGSQCVQNCPAGYYQPLNTLICAKCNSICSTCSSNTSCTTCINLSYSPPSCTDTTNQCASNQYRNSSTTCANCFNTCVTCYGPSSSECSSCSGSLILMGSSCVTSCLSGYYSYTNSANNNQLQCKLCS